MKKICKYSFFLLLLCSISFLLQPKVIAKTCTFQDIHLKLDIKDEIICIPKNTPNTDPLWTQAGIIDVKTEKKHLSDMGGQAILFDPTTKTLIRLLSKPSKESNRIFHLGTISKEDREEFYHTMIKAEDSATVQVTEYSDGEFPFFRLFLQVKNEPEKQEIIYGTIVNGSMIYYDLYSETGSNIDESFQQALVLGTHFTKVYTKEEFDALSSRFIRKVLTTFLLIILTIVVLVIIQKRLKKKRIAEQKVRSDAISKYYAAKKSNPSSGSQEQLLYKNKTTYSSPLLMQFAKYTFIQKKMIYWCVVIALYIILAVMTYLKYNLSLPMILIIIAAIMITYFQYVKIEKFADQLWGQYKSSSDKVAVFHFYETYFTISGIQHLADYPYLQIQSINETHEFLYLYFDSEHGYCLSKAGFETEIDCIEFVSFIKTRITSGL